MYLRYIYIGFVYIYICIRYIYIQFRIKTKSVQQVFEILKQNNTFESLSILEITFGSFRNCSVKLSPSRTVFIVWNGYMEQKF